MHKWSPDAGYLLDPRWKGGRYRGIISSLVKWKVFSFCICSLRADLWGQWVCSIMRSEDQSVRMLPHWLLAGIRHPRQSVRKIAADAIPVFLIVKDCNSLQTWCCSFACCHLGDCVRISQPWTWLNMGTGFGHFVSQTCSTIHQNNWLNLWPNSISPLFNKSYSARPP